MDDVTFHLIVRRADREALVLCLALGTLEAMRLGAWPLEAGIWTLGRPIFWEPLLADVDKAALDVIKSADELDALAELGGHAVAQAALDRMIAVLRSRLSALTETFWYARWSDETEATPPAV